jgi:hypothetical protein
MSKIADLLQDIESKITYAEVGNERVSKSNVAWHLDHSLKVINGVITTLQKSDTPYKWRFNLKRILLLTIKIIPRGKAKAPKTVRSFEEITIADIQRQLKTAHHLAAELETMDSHANFMHPYVGQLNLKQAIVFLGIHTKHHLKIIEDILKK